MRMIIVAPMGGVVFGFVEAKFLVAQIQKLFVDPGMQNVATTGVAAFLGALGGWFARGMAPEKSKG